MPEDRKVEKIKLGPAPVAVQPLEGKKVDWKMDGMLGLVGKALKKGAAILDAAFPDAKPEKPPVSAEAALMRLSSQDGLVGGKSLVPAAEEKVRQMAPGVVRVEVQVPVQGDADSRVTVVVTAPRAPEPVRAALEAAGLPVTPEVAAARTALEAAGKPIPPQAQALLGGVGSRGSARPAVVVPPATPGAPPSVLELDPRVPAEGKAGVKPIGQGADSGLSGEGRLPDKSSDRLEELREKAARELEKSRERVAEAERLLARERRSFEGGEVLGAGQAASATGQVAAAPPLEGGRQVTAANPGESGGAGSDDARNSNFAFEKASRTGNGNASFAPESAPRGAREETLRGAPEGAKEALREAREGAKEALPEVGGAKDGEPAKDSSGKYSAEAREGAKEASPAEDASAKEAAETRESAKEASPAEDSSAKDAAETRESVKEASPAKDTSAKETRPEAAPARGSLNAGKQEGAPVLLVMKETQPDTAPAQVVAKGALPEPVLVVVSPAPGGAPAKEALPDPVLVVVSPAPGGAPAKEALPEPVLVVVSPAPEVALAQVAAAKETLLEPAPSPLSAKEAMPEAAPAQMEAKEPLRESIPAQGVANEALPQAAAAQAIVQETLPEPAPAQVRAKEGLPEAASAQTGTQESAPENARVAQSNSNEPAPAQVVSKETSPEAAPAQVSAKESLPEDSRAKGAPPEPAPAQVVVKEAPAQEAPRNTKEAQPVAATAKETLPEAAPAQARVKETVSESAPEQVSAQPASPETAPPQVIADETLPQGAPTRVVAKEALPARETLREPAPGLPVAEDTPPEPAPPPLSAQEALPVGETAGEPAPVQVSAQEAAPAQLVERETLREPAPGLPVAEDTPPEPAPPQVSARGALPVGETAGEPAPVQLSAQEAEPSQVVARETLREPAPGLPVAENTPPVPAPAQVSARGALPVGETAGEPAPVQVSAQEAEPSQVVARETLREPAPGLPVAENTPPVPAPAQVSAQEAAPAQAVARETLRQPAPGLPVAEDTPPEPAPPQVSTKEALPEATLVRVVTEDTVPKIAPAQVSAKDGLAEAAPAQGVANETPPEAPPAQEAAPALTEPAPVRVGSTEASSQAATVANENLSELVPAASATDVSPPMVAQDATTETAPAANLSQVAANDSPTQEALSEVQASAQGSAPAGEVDTGATPSEPVPAPKEAVAQPTREVNPPALSPVQEPPGEPLAPLPADAPVEAPRAPETLAFVLPVPVDEPAPAAGDTPAPEESAESLTTEPALASVDPDRPPETRPGNATVVRPVTESAEQTKATDFNRADDPEPVAAAPILSQKAVAAIRPPEAVATPAAEQPTIARSGQDGEADQRGDDHHATAVLDRGTTVKTETTPQAAPPPGAFEPPEIPIQTTDEVVLSEHLAQPSTPRLEAVANRHAAHTVTSLLKKANKEEEIQAMDEDTAVHGLGLIMKMVGGFNAGRSQRVQKRALALADELGVRDFRTRKQIRQGSLLADLGQTGLALEGADDQLLGEMGDFLERNPEVNLRTLHQATVLRDIGQAVIPEEIRAKAGALTDEETELMQLHPELGETIVSTVPALKHLAPIIRAHHERWDGQGYPDGLRATQIPLSARIIAVADSFEGLLEESSFAEARATLRTGAGAAFDPMLIQAFDRLLDSVGR